MQSITCARCGLVDPGLRRRCRGCHALLDPLPPSNILEPPAVPASPGPAVEHPRHPLDQALRWLLAGVLLSGIVGATLLGRAFLPSQFPSRFLPAAQAPISPAQPRPRPPQLLTDLTVVADGEGARCPLGSGDSTGLCTAALVLDGDTRTAWCQTVRGLVGEQRLRLTLPAEAEIRWVDLVSGGMQPGKIDWQDVGHATEARVSTDAHQQTIRLHGERRPPRERVILDPPWRTRELTITLSGLSPGRRHPELICLSEVSIWVNQSNRSEDKER